MTRLSRRRAIALVGGGIAGLAGCIGDDGPYDASGNGDTSSASDPENSSDGESVEPDESAVDETSIPVADEQLPVEYAFATLEDESVSGGVPKDGIPSIDDPEFEPVSEVGDRLEDGDPIFGAVIDGEAKAYPQSVLVYHEIVNDELGGESVAITYCPLTGTAMGFFRGGVEFGVSGDLVNSNLIMYDREGDSRWPQMLATAIEGPLRGASLREFPVFWSTWERWREAYPDSAVLTENTSYVRDYGDDPYGSYNPRGGYYEEDSPTMFTPLSADDRHPEKRMFLGSRPEDGPLAIDLESLESEGVVGLERDAYEYVAVYDDRIGAGHLYRSDEPTSFAYEEGDGTVIDDTDGASYDPDDLPLESVYAYDAMWFAWAGFYPSTDVYD